MNVDFHAHFNITDPEQIRKFVENCEKNECITAISGNIQYAGLDYPPNDFVIEQCKKYSHILVPIAQIELWDTAPDLGELHRLVDAGVRGIKCIYPYYGYDHDIYMDFYAECEKLGLPILFHTGAFRPHPVDRIHRRPVVTNMQPIRVDRIARSFPDLNIVIAHLGTSFWRVEAAEMIKLHANVYSDLGGCGQWMSLSAEELAHLLRPHILLCKDNEKFFNKLVFGSDCYINFLNVQTDGKLHYEQILRKLGVSQEIHDAVMGGTVAKWLKL